MQTTTSTIAPVAAPAIVANVSNVPAVTVAPAAVKPAKPAKPAKAVAKPAPDALRNADRDRCQANRAIVAPHYNGASLVSHNTVPPKLADALARVANPIQRAKSATVRDESALMLARKHCDKSGTFCPVAATADLGALSRLASLGFLAVSGNRIALTKAGASRAALIAKRA